MPVEDEERELRLEVAFWQNYIAAREKEGGAKAVHFRAREALQRADERLQAFLGAKALAGSQPDGENKNGSL